MAMRTEVMAGQYLDIVEQARGATTVERALRVARFKSAMYTVERPLLLGAAIADAPDETVAVYSTYGENVGEAFQLTDDLAGVFGDPAITGKPVGDDLREGKQTVLIAVALERSSEAGAALLRERLGNSDLSEDEIDELRDVIVAAGAHTVVNAMITSRWDTAINALGALPLETSDLQRAGVDALVALADAATQPPR
jgi:geranylgeranyl diphosphate synthase type I